MTSACDLASQWRIVHYLARPTEVLKYLICLFGVLRRFQHCTGHITTGSWKGRGNQYIEFARVVYLKYLKILPLISVP